MTSTCQHNASLPFCSSFIYDDSLVRFFLPSSLSLDNFLRRSSSSSSTFLFLVGERERDEEYDRRLRPRLFAYTGDTDTLLLLAIDPAPSFVDFLSRLSGVVPSRRRPSPRLSLDGCFFLPPLSSASSSDDE